MVASHDCETTAPDRHQLLLHTTRQLHDRREKEQQDAQPKNRYYNLSLTEWCFHSQAVRFQQVLQVAKFGLKDFEVSYLNTHKDICFPRHLYIAIPTQFPITLRHVAEWSARRRRHLYLLQKNGYLVLTELRWMQMGMGVTSNH